jgi:Cd2+/Zn2+-exporting ATPase
MAGDGINDAPALSEAEVGIAMGTGTDVAMQSAGITLVKGDLRGIAKPSASAAPPCATSGRISSSPSSTTRSSAFPPSSAAGGTLLYPLLRRAAQPTCIAGCRHEPEFRSPSSGQRARADDLRMTRLARDNTLARVMQLVAEAQEQKSPTQRFTETFARRFVPAVLVGTLLVIVLLPLVFGWTWSASFYRGMLLLVAASPCALAIGTPAAVLAGIAQAARRGVLIKGGVHLENLGHLKTVALDKTGTLTTGCFAVTQVIGFEGTSEDEVLRIAAAVEEQSSHPLAKAIVKTTTERNITFPSATEIENLAGKGIQAEVEGAEVLVGAMRAFAGDRAAEKGQPLADAIAKLEGEGQTTVIIRRAGKFIGVIALADEPRASVKEVMQRLRAQGIERLVMLTGDNASVAHRVAEHVGITDVRAELLPGNKLTLIQELQHGHGVIAMIGDGVNDAPALAAASVGVAMGAGGTAVALETADVVLMGDDLGKLPFAIGLSRASARIIRQNLIMALGVIGLLLIASGFGVIPLSVAVVLHEGSTIVVVLNALRLLTWHEHIG